jgi:hypothetical protein
VSNSRFESEEKVSNSRLHRCAALLLEKERIDRPEFEALFDNAATDEA